MAKQKDSGSLKIKKKSIKEQVSNDEPIKVDLDIKHDGSDSYIQNSTGDLYIRNFSDNKDVIFQSDDGSGGITDYFRLDGSTVTTVASKQFKFEDNVKLFFGTGADSAIYASGDHLIIEQTTDDKDIAFKCDDGSGGIATYMTIDGGITMTTFSKDTRHNDNIKANFGDSGDLEIFHNGTDSSIRNFEGDLIIRNADTDKDVIFQADDGLGGVTTYFKLDGSSTDIQYFKDLLIADNVKAIFGNSNDLQIYHDSTTSNIVNNTGNLSIINNANNSDIKFFSDDGSGGVAEYFRLDGGDARTIVSRQFRFLDNVALKIGTSGDLSLSHDATNTRIENFTGALKIINNTDDGDIEFFCDDGSGGLTTYFFLDGSSVTTQFYKTIKLYDSAFLYIGDSNDFQFYHNGTNSTIQNFTGNLTIRNDQDDGDIELACDDGSGGVTPYFTLDGSDGNVKVYKQFGFLDNVKATFGNSGDLEVYHSGSHSFINGSNGAGSLYLRPGAGGTIQLETPSGVDMISTNATDVRMYSSGNERLRVKNIGINIQNVPTYADNTAAIAGGLTTGDVYRTGDLLKIVH